MGFNHHQYNTQYVLNAREGGAPINDAESYDVRIVEADNVAEGEQYWRIIGVHHLLPRENFSKHNLYIEILDEEGRRVNNPIGWAGWTWEGRQSHERADPVSLDKPDFEPAGNIGMFFGQKVACWIKGQSRDGNDKTDKVENIHTAHPDEPLPDGSLLNTLGHHSFYVVFQRTRKSDVVNDGVIKGRVERGQGHTIRLFQGNNQVGEQIVGPNLTFEFKDLAMGGYRLAIVGTDVTQENINLTPDNRTVHIDLAIPIPDDSVIFGRITNGHGKILLLITQGTIISRFPLPPSESYRFADLAAGTYALQVFDTDVREDNIVLDGTNQREINLTVPDAPPPSDKSLNYYMLFSPDGSRGRQTNLLLAVNYILAFSPTVGFSVKEAKLARQVTIIGDDISPTDEQAIADSGSKVERLGGHPHDIEDELNTRISQGRTFST